MCRFSVASLSLFALIPPVFTYSNSPSQPYPNNKGIALRPINIVDYEASMGLQRRGPTGLSVMDPQNHTDLVYGNFHGETLG